MAMAVMILIYYWTAFSFTGAYIVITSLNSIEGSPPNNNSDDDGPNLPEFPPPIIDGPANSNFQIDLVDPIDCIDPKYKETELA